MKNLLISFLLLIPVLSSATADELYINDGDEVIVKIQDCGAKTTPVLTVKNNKVTGNCVAHVTFCKAETGYLIPDGHKTSYYTFTKTPNYTTEKKLIKRVRPEYVSHPAIYQDLERELKIMIKQGICDKGIYTRGTVLSGYYTDVIVEL